MVHHSHLVASSSSSSSSCFGIVCSPHPRAHSYVKAGEHNPVHVRSIYAIGSLYDGGRGVERDHKQAFFW